MSGLVSSFLARDLFLNFGLRTGELAPILTLLLVQRGPLLLEMESALVGDVTRRNRDYRAQWRKRIDLGINFSLELGPIALSLGNTHLTCKLESTQSKLRSFPFCLLTS